MKKILISVMIIALFACNSNKVPTVVSLTNSDSVHTSVNVDKEVVYRDTTVYIEVPVEVKQIIAEDSSFLETSVAWSNAVIRQDGKLYHSIENKPVSLSDEVQLKDTKERKDSIVYRYIHEELPVPTPVEVERALTKWQKFQINSGRLFWVLLLVYIIWKLRKPLRRLIVGV